MAFPTLSRRPMKVTRTTVDNTIRNESEAGYDVRKPRFTRVNNKFTVTYDKLPQADITLLEAHFASVGTHTVFDWDDLSGVTYTVYYDAPLEVQNFVPGWFIISAFTLKEI